MSKYFTTHNAGSLDWRGTERTRARLETGYAADRRFQLVGELEITEFKISC